MIYMIDLQHFLVDMIDYFTNEELANMEYMIISNQLIKNQKKVLNVAKPYQLYPTPEMISSYAQYKTLEVAEKLYEEYFTPDDKTRWQDNIIYTHFISPLLNHQDVVMVAHQDEFHFPMAIASYLRKHFDIEVINLNELFTKGRIGPIHIDRKEIRDRAVDVRIVAERIKQKTLESTEDGRAKLMSIMTKKEKIKKLKQLGIRLKGDETSKEINELLIDDWVKDRYGEETGD